MKKACGEFIKYARNEDRDGRWGSLAESVEQLGAGASCSRRGPFSQG